MRYFAGQPETDLRFGPDVPVETRLLGGWADPHPDGLKALGHESRLELPQPVAEEDFILSLDLSPFIDPPAPPSQRITVVVNGETVRQALLSERELLHSRITRSNIESADRLAVTLLHPDAGSAASPVRPLDDQTLSIVLHRLTLTPASLHTATNAEAALASPSGFARPTRQLRQRQLFGPDVLLPPDAILRQIKTHWDTLVFADTKTGLLRHGPQASSPQNIMLAENRGTACLLHVKSGGKRYSTRIAPVGSLKIETDLAQSNEGLQTFQIRPVDDRKFGLQDEGLLLCAEGDGRITLSRKILGPWERFEIVQPGENLTRRGGAAVGSQPRAAQPTADPASAAKDRDTMLRFCSLGNNCEFGQAQRVYGAEPLDLLRWASSNYNSLMSVLTRRFDGIGDPDKLQVLPTVPSLMVKHVVYGFQWHAFADEGVTADAIHAREIKRIPFLANKLMEEFAEARRIFVIKPARGSMINGPEASKLLDLMDTFGGRPTLMFVQEGAEKPSVTEVAPRLLLGRLTEFADQSAVPGTTRSTDWLSLCQQALKLETALPGAGIEGARDRRLAPASEAPTVD